MTERKVIDCDRCGKQITGHVIKVPIPAGVQPDAAGGPSDTVFDVKDCCPACAEKLIWRMFHTQELGADGKFVRYAPESEFCYNANYHDEHSPAVKAAKVFFEKGSTNGKQN